MQDGNEDGIPGVVIVITDSQGDTYTVTTDTDGKYSLDVPIGLTTTDIDNSTVPDNYVRTEGEDVSTIFVPANGSVTDIDGFVPPGAIIGVIFNDTDGDGVQDAGEVGIPGVVIEILVTIYVNDGSLMPQIAREDHYTTGINEEIECRARWPMLMKRMQNSARNT